MQGASIGPNAVTQMLRPVELRYGADGLQRLLAIAGIDRLPDLSGLMDEAPAVRLHEALRRTLPDAAPEIGAEAGAATAEYVLANRIPKLARILLPLLPPRMAARVLARAVGRHAWPFVGSGKFRVTALAPVTFEIAENPLAAHHIGPANACHWHRAAFETLFRRLVSRRAVVEETCCCGRGDPCCRFVIEF